MEDEKIIHLDAEIIIISQNHCKERKQMLVEQVRTFKLEKFHCNFNLEHTYGTNYSQQHSWILVLTRKLIFACYSSS